MNPKAKKIIAREGLTAIALISFGTLLWKICYSTELLSNYPALFFRFKHMAIFLFYTYPAYLIIRFIIWAIRILKIPGIDISVFKISIAEMMKKIADHIKIGYIKETNTTTITNITKNFILNMPGYTIPESRIPEIEKHAKEVLVAGAKAVEKTPDKQFKSLYYGLVALNDISAIASGTSAGAIVQNADYIFKGIGQPTVEVRFIEPSKNANVFNVELPPEQKEK